jgi:hypothetical protein
MPLILIGDFGKTPSDPVKKKLLPLAGEGTGKVYFFSVKAPSPERGRCPTKEDGRGRVIPN